MVNSLTTITIESHGVRLFGQTWNWNSKGDRSVHFAMEASTISDNHQTKVLSSKPIKKREKTGELEDASDDDENHEQNEDSSTHQFEIRARNELDTFLSNKNIDPKYALTYVIHIRPTKKRLSSGGTTDSFSVTYSGPDGSILTSKSDVYNSIMNSFNKKPVVENANTTAIRHAAHEESKESFHDMNDNLPVNFDGIKVIRFGKINTSPAFSSTVQIYPVGYKAEIVIPGVSLNQKSSSSSANQVLLVEITNVNDKPEFNIMDKTCSHSFIASSESSVWKKVRKLIYYLSSACSFCSV